LHPDHEAIGRLTVRIIEETNLTPEIYLFHTRRPNVAVDITTVAKEKAEAFSAHVSQNGGNTGEGPVRRMRDAGKRLGLPPVELFRKLE
jgi:LmbE family N-acetylglucosaminyl deacetylase